MSQTLLNLAFKILENIQGHSSKYPGPTRLVMKNLVSICFLHSKNILNINHCQGGHKASLNLYGMVCNIIICMSYNPVLQAVRLTGCLVKNTQKWMMLQQNRQKNCSISHIFELTTPTTVMRSQLKLWPVALTFDKDTEIHGYDIMSTWVWYLVSTRWGDKVVKVTSTFNIVLQQ